MKFHRSIGLSLALTMPLTVFGAMQNYQIDAAHSFVMFEISHLGISTTIGQFEGIEGEFSFDDKDPTQCKVTALINTNEIDTNHAERDKHIRGKDFLNTSEHATAKFSSTACKGNQQTGVLSGNLEFMGMSKPIDVKITKIGEGADPWGGYRAGFEGEFTINRRDFGIDYNLGPDTDEVVIQVFIEGIKKS